MAKTITKSGKAGISVRVNFDDLLEKIKEAEGNIEEATWEAARVGGKVMYDELKAEATASGVPAHLTNWPTLSMQAERDGSGNRFACRVGWKMANYDPNNPAPEYKVIFLNYGTPRRTVKGKKYTHMQIDGEWITATANRGYVTGRGFIGRAKKKARPKIKKAQKEALTKILKELT